MKKLLFHAILFCVILTSCSKSKDLDYNSNEVGLMKLKFDPIVNGKKLVLKDYVYTNASNESYTIETAKFFISNIKLTDNQGNDYLLPKKESYFLIDAALDSTLFPRFTIPQGEYTSIEFNIGIDSMTNTLPIEDRIGVLDIAKSDMYWSWNAGYIFFKLEGHSPQSTTLDKKFRYHIGLYGGYNSPTVNNNRNIKIDLNIAGVAKVQKDMSADIHLMVDLGKIFDGPNTISIANHPTVMTSGPHQLIAENYSKLFTHDHTHNFQALK